MADFLQRSSHSLGWAITTLFVVLLLSAFILAGGDDAALRSGPAAVQASSRRLVDPSPP